jgi:phosphoribosyl-ATP pyrophosphohydrolase
MSTLEIKTFTALREKLGEETADVLMEYISAKQAGVLTEEKADAKYPSEERLRQVFATREDLARLETKFSQLETRIEAGFNSQLKWLILLMLGCSSLIITVVKLL